MGYEAGSTLITATAGDLGSSNTSMMRGGNYMKREILCGFVIVLTSCLSEHGRPQESADCGEPASGARAAESASAEMQLQESPREAIAKYMKRYYRDTRQDTTLSIGGASYRISLVHRCTFDSSVIVTTKYFDTGTGEPFVTHNFVTHIDIVRGSRTVYSKTISKNQFRRQVYEPWYSSSVIFDAAFYEYYVAKRSFVFSFSISIPLTDLGTNATLLVDLDGKDTFTGRRYRN